MHPIAALILSESLEAERRRALRHPRRWLNEESSAHAERRASSSGIFRFPRFLRLAGSTE
jgi:hypothetical protein